MTKVIKDSFDTQSRFISNDICEMITGEEPGIVFFYRNCSEVTVVSN